MGRFFYDTRRGHPAAQSKSYPISNEFTDVQSDRVANSKPYSANSKPYSISNEFTDDTCQFAMRGELILERREWAMCSNNSVWRRGVRVASTDDSQ